MKYSIKIISSLILSFSSLLLFSCNKNINAQYFGKESAMQSNSNENLVTVMFDENIFQKYKNDIEVFSGINQTNDNLRIKHIVPRVSKILLDPGDYTFFVNSKNKYTLVENDNKKVSRPLLYKIFFNGEPGKVYTFSQKNKGREESFEFTSAVD